jgi:hypothetical protein
MPATPRLSCDLTDRGQIELSPTGHPLAPDSFFDRIFVRLLETTIAALSNLPGIGPWTAQDIAMRALREPDAFPQEISW